MPSATAIKDDADLLPTLLLRVRRGEDLASVSVEEIKRGLESLSKKQQDEVSAFLFHLRHARDADYQREIDARLADRDPAHWLTPEGFERRLDQGRD